MDTVNHYPKSGSGLNYKRNTFFSARRFLRAFPAPYASETFYTRATFVASARLTASAVLLIQGKLAARSRSLVVKRDFLSNIAVARMQKRARRTSVSRASAGSSL